MISKKAHQKQHLKLFLCVIGLVLVLVCLYGLLCAAISIRDAERAPELLERSFTIPVSDKATEQEALPSTIWEKGYRYTLLEANKADYQKVSNKIANYKAQQISYVSPESCDGSTASAKSLISKDFLVDENGYKGTIDLKDVSCKEVLGFYDAQVDKTIEYEGLTSNDVNAIPESIELPPTELIYDATTSLLTYYRAGVIFQETAWDINDIPIEYKAIVTYRASETRAAVASYEITANYAGEVAYTSGINTQSASYQLDSAYKTASPLELIASGLLSADELSEGLLSSFSVSLITAATNIYEAGGWQGVGAACLLTTGFLIATLLLLISYLLWQRNLEIGGLS